MSKDASAGADSASGDATHDAAADAAPTARCNPTAPFGAGHAVTELNTTSQENSVSLSSDELTAYLSSNRPGGAGGYDIYVATRASRTAPFSTPQLLPGVNTTMDESHPVVTPNGLAIYASQVQTDYKITRAVRSSTAEPFGRLSLVTDLDSPDASVYDSDVSFAANGNAYFSSMRTGTPDLYIATPNGNSGAFFPPTVVNGVDLETSFFEGCAVISPDEKTLVFCSNRPGGVGGFDLYMTVRASATAAFPAITPLAALNTAEHDQASWLSADGCVLYYVSGTNNSDIYVTTRGM